jgi:hypothetical protein
VAAAFAVGGAFGFFSVAGLSTASAAFQAPTLRHRPLLSNARGSAAVSVVPRWPGEAQGRASLLQTSALGNDRMEELRFELMTMTPARLNFRLSQVLLERVALLEPQNAAEIADLLLEAGPRACIDMVTDPPLLEAKVAQAKFFLQSTGRAALMPKNSYTMLQAQANKASSLCNGWYHEALTQWKNIRVGNPLDMQRSSSTVNRLGELVQFFDDQVEAESYAPRLLRTAFGSNMNLYKLDTKALFALSAETSAPSAVLVYTANPQYLEITDLVANTLSGRARAAQARLVEELVHKGQDMGLSDIRMSPQATATLWAEPSDFGFKYPSNQLHWLQYQPHP